MSSSKEVIAGNSAQSGEHEVIASTAWQPGSVSEKLVLLALHRRLYLLESGEGKINGSVRGELYNMLKTPLHNLEKEKREYIEGLIPEEEIKLAKKIVAEAASRGIDIVSWFDPAYPLHHLDSPPPILFIKGRLPEPTMHPYIAIVGSRKPTPYGKDVTEKIVRGLVGYGATIVSGLAYGIDAAAHRAAVESKLPAIAVLGSGINSLYPRANLSLADNVAQNGAIISEFPWGTPPLKQNFPLRNRVISGLSLAVIVVEAVIKSGSLITAKWAAEQGKEVFAVPGNIDRAMSMGTNLLIKDGAHLLESSQDIAEILHLQPCVTTSESKKKAGQRGTDDDIKRAIVKYLKSGGKDLDGLAESVGLSVDKLLPLITEVELTEQLG